jgi:hypothetical protein
MKNLFFSLLAVGFSACSSGSSVKSADVLASNDFEQLDGWLGSAATPSLNRERAHSGEYSVKVDPKIDYSLGYNNQLGRISPTRLHKLKIHCWVFLSNSKTAVALVTDVSNPDPAKSLVHHSYDLAKATRPKGYHQWIEVEYTIDLPETVTSNSQLVVYLWRADSQEPAYLDDLQILKAE